MEIDAARLEMMKKALRNSGFEAYKKVKIPIINNDGECCGERIPYKEDKQVQTFVDFMLVYLDEAIKSLDKNKEK